MITFLDGTLVTALPTQATVDVRGIGYEVFIPLSSYDKLPSVGQPIRILTHLAVREDAHVLYGFMTAAERDLFRLLVNNVSRHRAEVGARGFERDERDQLQSGCGELRCCSNFEN